MSDLAKLLAIYPDLVRSTAVAADQFSPPGTNLASDVVGAPGDFADTMWRGIGVPHAARQTIVQSNPALEGGQAIRAQTSSTIGPAFLRVLMGDFLPGSLSKRDNRTEALIRALGGR
jgi:hypothetical protein